jgi:hypothetical protein
MDLLTDVNAPKSIDGARPFVFQNTGMIASLALD